MRKSAMGKAWGILSAMVRPTFPCLGPSDGFRGKSVPPLGGIGLRQAQRMERIAGRGRDGLDEGLRCKGAEPFPDEALAQTVPKRRRG